jgi:hypothetical protein
MSFTVNRCHGLSGLGLSYLVANKQFLVQLKIFYCPGISSEGYHCLTSLTNLCILTVSISKLDDIGLKMLCSSCLLTEYLDFLWNNLITKEGLNNIHCLLHLNSLSLSGASDDWLAKLSHSTALTQLDLKYNSTVSDEGLRQLSSLFMLTFVNVNGQKRVLRQIG